MEAEVVGAGLGLGTIIILVLLGMYYGLFSTVQTVADGTKQVVETSMRMGNRQLLQIENEQIKNNIDWLVSNKFNEVDAAVAAEQKALYETMRKL
jgi:predicted metalloprotease